MIALNGYARHEISGLQLYRGQAASRPAPFWTQRIYPAAVEPTPVNAPLPAMDTIVRLANEATVQLPPVIHEDLVVRRSALIHPGLPRPVFFGGVFIPFVGEHFERVD